MISMVHLPMLPVRPCVSSCFQAADVADNSRSIMAFEDFLLLLNVTKKSAKFLLPFSALKDHLAKCVKINKWQPELSETILHEGIRPARPLA